MPASTQHHVIATTDPLDQVVADATKKKFSQYIRPELGISALYILLGTLWIVSSDSWLLKLQEHSDLRIYLSALKGVNFVVTTGLLLFVILKKSFGGWRKSEQRFILTLEASRNRFRNLSKKCEQSLETERTRIAREVHDELGQRLTGLKIRIRSVEDAIADRNDRSLNELIDQLVEACELIDGTIDAVRTISHGLRPPALDELGLVDAIKDEAMQFEERVGVKCDLDIDEYLVKMDGAAETAIFRIFQECLTNIARHAKATSVVVKCKRHDGTLMLMVEDNGVGMNNLSKDCVDSLGLLGMIERAEDIGAKLMIESAQGKGTKVVCMIPVVKSILSQKD